MTTAIALGALILVAAAGVPAARAAPPRRVARHTAIWTAPPTLAPTASMPDGPLLGNGDLGVTLAGPAEAQRFHIGKNDFWTRKPGDASIIAVGGLTLDIPDLRGATYRQVQDLSRAEVRGEFAAPGLTVRTVTRVDANSNLLVTSLRVEGRAAGIALRQTAGPLRPVPLRVEPSPSPVSLGREQFAGGRWYFHGEIAGASVLPRALGPDEIAAAAAAPRPEGARFDGHSDWRELPAPSVEHAMSASAWIRIAGVSPEANYIISKGEWNRAYSLGLSNGRLRWAINGICAQTEQPLPHDVWLHVAGVFNGRALSLFVNGKPEVGGDAGTAVGCDPAAGQCWFSRRADTLPGRPRTVAVATRILGAAVRPAGPGDLAATLTPGRPLTIISAVLSDIDADDPLAEARHRVTELRPAAVARLAARHRAWWSGFWSRSFIEIPDAEIERRWYAALYVLGSCSRAGKVAPGLWGSWVTTDSPNWHGDFHLNYNFQAPYYPAFSSNHADLTAPFFQAIAESMENGRAMARRHGWKGVHFPVCIGPWGLSPENPDGDWGQRSNAAFAALPFIWQYQYTGDAAFLRDSAYPYLLEVAAFWEDYLRLESGRYVIHSDSIHEGSGPDVNPILTLGLLRTLFTNLVSMSEELDRDADRRGRWRHILARLSPFPLQQREGMTVFRYSEQGMDWCDGNTLGIHHIFPAGAIGLESDPALLAISRSMIAAMRRWADYNGFASWYTACARVGFDPTMILTKMREECDRHSLPNLLLYYGGGGIESAGGFLAINEMLLQSHEGILRLFPCWPRSLDARFGTLRARGAFLVSARLRAGVIGAVRIHSEQGGACTLQNPWPGRALRIIRAGLPAERLSGPRLTLPTVPGETVTLAPLR